MLYSSQRLPRPIYRNFFAQGSAWIDRYIEMVDALLAKAETFSPSIEAGFAKSTTCEENKILRKTA